MSARGGAGTALEVARVFGPLGVRAFGGPAVHVALMRREVVDRRGWVDEPTFRELFAACSVIPGPASTQLALLLGLRRAGWLGLAAAGACFIVPSVAIMIGLAAVYVAAGAQGRIQGPLRGVDAAVVAVVAVAVLDLLREPLRRPETAAVALLGLVLGLLGVPPLLALAAGAVAVAAVRRRPARGPGRPPRRAAAAAVTLTAVPPSAGSLGLLALTFLKIGAVAFGSGYLLLPFLRADLGGAPWHLGDARIADAFAFSQATPGPVFGVAGFLGYLVAGLPGGVVAAAAIFTPSFVLVPLVGRVVEAVRRQPLLAAALAGVAAAAVGLIGSTLAALGRVAWVSPLDVAITAASAAALLRWPLGQPWVVLAGGLAGAL